MHPAEMTWQFWRKDPIFREVVHTYPAYAHMNDPRVVAEPVNIITHLTPKLGRDYMFRNMDLFNKLARMGNGLLAYRESKHIFQITAELARELAKLKTTLTLPMRELRLPRRGCVLDFSAYLGVDHPQAQVFLSYDVDRADGPDSKGTLQIQVMTFTANEPQILMTIPARLDGQSVWGSTRKALADHSHDMQRALQGFRDAHPEPAFERLVLQAVQDDPCLALMRQWEAEMKHCARDISLSLDEYLAANPVLPLVVNTLLYLQGDPDVVKVVHPGMRPAKKLKQAPNWGKLARKLDNATPTVQRIGERFTTAIKLYEIERAKMRAEHEARGTKCPHLRAPHPHIYRIGEARLDVIVKFLGWIGVRGAEVPQVLKEAYAPVVTPVK